MIFPVARSSSFSRLLVFWWALFVIIQQTQRLFLFPETAALEWPTTGLLMRTLGAGLVGDMISATGAVAVAAVLGVLLTIPASRLSKTPKRNGGAKGGVNQARRGGGGPLFVVSLVGVGSILFPPPPADFF